MNDRHLMGGFIRRNGLLLGLLAVVTIVVALIVALLWPDSTPNATAPGVTVATTVPQQATAIPTASAATSESAGAPSAPTTYPQTVPQPTSRETLALGVPATIMPGADPADLEAKATTCLAFVERRYTYDTSKPYPGFDYRSLAAMTTGRFASTVAADLRAWGAPSSADSERYAARKARGVRQVASTRHLWLSNHDKPGQTTIVTVGYAVGNGVSAPPTVRDSDLQLFQCTMAKVGRQMEDRGRR